MSKRTQSPPPRFALEIAHYATCAGIPDAAEAFGIDRAILDDPEAMVPITVVYGALERAAAHCGDPHFGLRFALYWTKASKAGLGALQFLLLSSSTLRVACDRILHYQEYWGPAEWYDVVESDGAYRVRYRCWGPPREAHVHQAEKMAVLTALVPRAIDPTCKPLAVTFEHARRAGDEELARVLGVTPSYCGPYTEVALPVDVMDRPLPQANPPLFEYLDRSIGKELAATRNAAQPLPAQVYATVQRLLPDRGFGPEMVARALGCSPRTLARRLADDGTSLREIVDAVRKERAQAYLEAGVPIKEVAFLLGYSDPTAFQHAFRRWHGMGPKAWLEARSSSSGENEAGPAGAGPRIRTAS